MNDGMLLVLAGPPGAGKTTVGAIIASESPQSACIHSDWFWTTIVNGHIPPWDRPADAQNRAMIRAATAAAVRMANAGFTTVLEGILGPWHFEPLRDELAACMAPVHHAVLRPDGDTCLVRARGRVLESPELRDALTDEDPIRHMWDQFSHPGSIDRYVIDSSEMDPQETTMLIQERIKRATWASLLRIPERHSPACRLMPDWRDDGTSRYYPRALPKNCCVAFQ